MSMHCWIRLRRAYTQSHNIQPHTCTPIHFSILYESFVFMFNQMIRYRVCARLRAKVFNVLISFENFYKIYYFREINSSLWDDEHKTANCIWLMIFPINNTHKHYFCIVITFQFQILQRYHDSTLLKTCTICYLTRYPLFALWEFFSSYKISTEKWDANQNYTTDFPKQSY